MIGTLSSQYVDSILSRMSADELLSIETTYMASFDDIAMQEYLLSRDIQLASANDVLHQALYSGASWGDLMLDAPASAFMKEEPVEKVIRCSLPEDWDWHMPALKLRKDIWENFPVVVNKIFSKDSKDRYAIQWHRKNFNEWREEVDNYLDYIDYEVDTERRLFKALAASPYWTVEAGQTAQDLCVIAMNFAEEKYEATKIFPSKEVEDDKTETASVASAASAGWVTVGKTKEVEHQKPVLRRLNDIKAAYPVVWSEVNTGNPKAKVYAIQLFNKALKERNLNAVTVKAELLAALKLSPSWTVLKSVDSRDVCQISMNIAA